MEIRDTDYKSKEKELSRYIKSNSLNYFTLESINRHSHRLMVIAELIKKMQPKTILDIGCGVGYLSKALKIMQYTKGIYYGIDKNSNAIKLAKRKSKQLAPNSNLIDADLMNFDYSNLHPDIVTAIEVIEHLRQDEIERLKSEVFGSIKPKHVIISTPNFKFTVNEVGTDDYTSRNRDHKFEFTSKEFNLFCKSITKQFHYKFSIDELNTHYKTPFSFVATFERVRS